MVLEDNIAIENPHNVEIFWPLSIFDELVSKSNKILLVFANTKGERKTPNEEFHFVEAYLLADMNRDKFVKAIAEDMLKIDIRIGVYGSGRSVGKYHDHGTGFRVNKRSFLELFDTYRQLI